MKKIFVEKGNALAYLLHSTLEKIINPLSAGGYLSDFVTQINIDDSNTISKLNIIKDLDLEMNKWYEEYTVGYHILNFGTDIKNVYKNFCKSNAYEKFKSHFAPEDYDNLLDLDFNPNHTNTQKKVQNVEFDKKVKKAFENFLNAQNALEILENKKTLDSNIIVGHPEWNVTSLDYYCSLRTLAGQGLSSSFKQNLNYYTKILDFSIQNLVNNDKLPPLTLSAKNNWKKESKSLDTEGKQIGVSEYFYPEMMKFENQEKYEFTEEPFHYEFSKNSIDEKMEALNSKLQEYKRKNNDFYSLKNSETVYTQSLVKKFRKSNLQAKYDKFSSNRKLKITFPLANSNDLNSFTIKDKYGRKVKYSSTFFGNAVKKETYDINGKIIAQKKHNSFLRFFNKTKLQIDEKIKAEANLFSLYLKYKYKHKNQIGETSKSESRMNLIKNKLNVSFGINPVLFNQIVGWLGSKYFATDYQLKAAIGDEKTEFLEYLATVKKIETVTNYKPNLNEKNMMEKYKALSDGKECNFDLNIVNLNPDFRKSSANSEKIRHIEFEKVTSSSKMPK